MTETLEPAVLPHGSPLARLFAIAAESATVGEVEQRDAAELTAGHHLYTQYSDTLDRALEPEDWNGHPSVKTNRLEASAVAWLHGGLWLHHTLDISEAYGARDVLTLIVPCACGTGYVEYELEDEDDLIGVLTDLRRTGGHVWHESSGEECASVPDPHAQTTK
ncbi:hypothetical protein [Streptomyces niveus]|uniref:hypothetical protein n=1 Tax=Streptomyces niveus TaxID=193462 RepID=UPI0037944CE9